MYVGGGLDGRLLDKDTISKELEMQSWNQEPKLTEQENAAFPNGIYKTDLETCEEGQMSVLNSSEYLEQPEVVAADTTLKENTLSAGANKEEKTKGHHRRARGKNNRQNETLQRSSGQMCWDQKRGQDHKIELDDNCGVLSGLQFVICSRLRANFLQGRSRHNNYVYITTMLTITPSVLTPLPHVLISSMPLCPIM